MINRKLIAAVSVTVLFGFTVFATLSACSNRNSQFIDNTSYQPLNEQEYGYSGSLDTNADSKEFDDYSRTSAEEYTTEASRESTISSENTVPDATIQNETQTRPVTEDGSSSSPSSSAGNNSSDASKETSGEKRTEATSKETQSETESSKAESTTVSDNSYDKESGEGTQFVFTSIKINDNNYDYYTYLINKGYVPIKDTAGLSSYCEKNILSLDGGAKGISYIITENGLFDDMASGMEKLKSQADSTKSAKDMFNRDSYLYGELGLDYQAYYSRGVAIFMIKKIQNVTNNRGDYSVYAVYYYSYETKEQVQLVDSIVSQAVKDFSGTDYDKMLAAYDYLRDKADYAENVNESMAHTAYGVFINKSAVCEGYAKAYKLMLDAMGITNEIVFNDVHAWNVVQYEGQWYVVDVTNGDVNSCYAYFMLGQDVLYSEKRVVVDGYIFTTGTIAGYGYTDGSNTDIRTLAKQSFQRKIEQ